MAGIPLPDVRTAAPRYRSRHLRVLAALRRAHPAFLGAEPAALARLAAVTTIGVVPRDGTVFLEGEPAGQLFVVAAGTVRLYTLLADGRRQVFGFPGPGDVFGLETDAGGG